MNARMICLTYVTATLCLSPAAPPSALAEQPRLDPADFAILPWGWTPGDESALREIHACGFNLAGFVAPKHVDLVEQAGLQCIVSDKRITNGIAHRIEDDEEIAKRVSNATRRLRDHPAVFGWYLRDEPDAPYLDVLSQWCDAFRDAVPDPASLHQSVSNLRELPGHRRGGLRAVCGPVREQVQAPVHQLRQLLPDGRWLAAPGVLQEPGNRAGSRPEERYSVLEHRAFQQPLPIRRPQ